jgi:hypothetical protein
LSWSEFLRWSRGSITVRRTRTTGPDSGAENPPLERSGGFRGDVAVVARVI